MLDPEDVCSKAKVIYDRLLNTYTLNMFGKDINVSMTGKAIHSSSYVGDLLLNKLSDYSRISIRWYLISAKDIVFTQKLVRPEGLKGEYTQKVYTYFQEFPQKSFLIVPNLW